MTASVSAISNALQTIWPQDKLDESMFETSRTLAMIPKSDGFTENDETIVFETGPNAGGSTSFTKAQTNVGASSFHKLTYSRKKNYQIFRIETEALRAARKKGSKGLLDILKRESKNAIYACNQIAAADVFGTGSGSLGRISSGGGTATLTLTDPADAVHFEEGMVIDTDDVDGGGTVDGNPNTIGSVDYDAGTLTTVSGNWNAGGGFSDNDYIFRDGDYDGRMYGLAAYLPLTVAAADAFGDNSLNRSQNRIRLAGTPYAATLANDGTLQNALINFISKMYRVAQKNKPDAIVMNTIRYGQLQRELGTAVVYDKLSAKGEGGKDTNFSFDVIKLATTKGMVDIIDDPYCPRDRAYALTWNSWKLRHLGGFPSWLDDDGNMGLRLGNADTIEWRLGSYHQLVCHAPVKNGVINLASLPDGLAA